MLNLVHQRCFNHSAREAVARCPECGQFFCRECITEHDDRMVCSACLKKLARTPITRRPAFAGVLRFGLCVVSLFVAWFFFFLVGDSLLRIPTSFHEGTLWQVKAIDE